MIPAWTTDIVTTYWARAVHYTLLWGLEGVALRTVGGAGDRVPFVNEAALRRRLDDAELAAVAVDPGLFEGTTAARAGWLNDLAALADTAAFCRRIGCSVVRIGALAAGEGAHDGATAADALRQAGAEAERHGLRLAVRNDVGTGVETGAALADLLGRAASPGLGADWRPADALQAGEDPADGLQALLSTGVPIVCVGVRDVRAEGEAWVSEAPGDGAVGWDGQLAPLAAAGFAGPLVLDDLPGAAGTHGLAAATALVRGVRRASRL